MENLAAVNYASVLVCNEDGHPFKDLYVFENEGEMQSFLADWLEREGVPFGYDTNVWSQVEAFVVPDLSAWVEENTHDGFNGRLVLNQD